MEYKLTADLTLDTMVGEFGITNVVIALFETVGEAQNWVETNSKIFPRWEDETGLVSNDAEYFTYWIANDGKTKLNDGVFPVNWTVTSWHIVSLDKDDNELGFFSFS